MFNRSALFPGTSVDDADADGVALNLQCLLRTSIETKLHIVPLEVLLIPWFHSSGLLEDFSFCPWTDLDLHFFPPR